MIRKKMKDNIILSKASGMEEVKKYFTAVLALSLSESLANDDIKDKHLWGVRQCSQSCHDAAHTVYGAVMQFKQR